MDVCLFGLQNGMPVSMSISMSTTECAGPIIRHRSVAYAPRAENPQQQQTVTGIESTASAPHCSLWRSGQISSPPGGYALPRLLECRAGCRTRQTWDGPLPLPATPDVTPTPPPPHGHDIDSEARRIFWLGFVQMLPGTTGSFSTGVICGAAAVAAGMSSLASMAMAAFGFAGTSQLVVMQLAVTGSALVVISLAGLIVNLRYAMFSLSLSRYLTEMTIGERWLATFFLTDPAYALSVARFMQHPDESPRIRYVFYMGATLAMSIGWFAGAGLGTALGAAMPASWQVEFCVPLTFLALVSATVRDRATVVAAAVGGITALLAVDFPYRGGLLVASIAGIAAGYMTESWQRR
jgi:predicted branched-subunit amino acid permease